MNKQENNYEFYSKKRWNNWIQQINTCNFSLEKETGGDVNLFINMIDDVILACLKIIARFDKKYLNENQSIENLFKIKKIVLEKINPISDDIDMMMISIQNSLLCVFLSFESYIYGNFDNKIDLSLMLEEAIKSKDENNLENSIEILSFIGASIISGQKLNSNYFSKKIETNDGIIIDWIDGLEAISASMEGTDNYKNFDESDENLESE